MQRLNYLIIGIYSLILSFGVQAQENYNVSGKVYEMKMLKGDWNGKHHFPNVYCLTFPNSSQAKSVRSAYLKNNAIYLVHVSYPNMIAAIAVSTIPKEQTSKQAFNKILKNERSNELKLKNSPIDYTVEQGNSDFGQTISITATNSRDGNKRGPFPLVRSFISSKENTLLSMSAHKLFIRGHDRFELAVIKRAPQNSDRDTKITMKKNLTSFVEQMSKSLQQCTSSIPIRKPN